MFVLQIIECVCSKWCSCCSFVTTFARWTVEWMALHDPLVHHLAPEWNPREQVLRCGVLCCAAVCCVRLCLSNLKLPFLIVPFRVLAMHAPMVLVVDAPLLFQQLVTCCAAVRTKHGNTRQCTAIHRRCASPPSPPSSRSKE